MDYSLAKGIAPGKIIAREIKKRNISQREFAKSINVHSQTLNAVINNHRKLTIELSLKIEKSLNLPEGTLLMLQVYHSIQEYKTTKNQLTEEKKKPQLRKILFWDTDFVRIDWIRQKDAVVRRVKAKGTKEEKEEIARFYNLSISDLS